MYAIDKHEGDETVVAETNKALPSFPLLAMWRHPRLAMRRFLEKRSLLPGYVFAAASGVGNAFTFIQTSELDDGITDQGLKLALTIGGGIVTGILFLWILSLLFMFFGRWLGGKGSFRELNVVVGWAMLPFVATLLTAIVELILYGDAFLLGGEALAAAQAAHPAAELTILLLNLFFSVYALVFLVAGIAEAHRLRTSQGAGVLGIFFILYMVLWIAFQAVAIGM